MLARLRKRLTNWNLESTLRPFRVPTVVKIDFFPSGFECLRVSVVLRSFSIDNYFHFSMYREMSCRAKIWACWGVSWVVQLGTLRGAAKIKRAR